MKSNNYYSNKKATEFQLKSPEDINEEDAKKFISKLGELRETMFETKKRAAGDFVFDKRTGEFGLVYGQFPKYSTDKVPRYAVLVINKGDGDEEFSFRVRYSPQHALVYIDPPISVTGKDVPGSIRENEISQFCNTQCLFGECDDCVFQKYNLRKTEDGDE